MFRGAPGSLACIQARLNIYNPDDGWLTRQFALEYSALFDAILPALDSLRLPLPLGGSSNHFRADLLRRVGGWDPYNVTEDADLGFRLARTGLLTVTLDSTTWEEAPARIGNWMRQRTRWIKGWIITYLVHTRAPGQLLRDLGWRRCAALHVLMGAILLSALFHPLCYALLAYGLLENCLFSDPSGSLGSWLWWIALFNLAVGHLSAILVAAVAVLRRGRPRLALHALLMPVYWLLISLAGYRSLVQLVRAPYLWEKTEHGARLGPRRRAGPRHQGSF
jgi:cellulose synthase/poly-beta-1,6-N-acetylglucosamine synthase-like glycosyltransferase